MIVCPECGTRNPPGTQFCGECGTFLEWAGDEAATAASSGATQVAQSGGGTTTAAPVSPPAPDTTAPEPPRPPDTRPPRPPEPRPRPENLAPRPPEPAPKPAPVAPETTPPDTGIRLVQPDAQQRRYVRAASDEPAVETPGDIECANCGVGNLANRKFCRSCGHLLARPVEEQKKSWWRRFWDKITGRGRRYEVGTRRVQRGSGWLRPLIAVLLIGGLGVAMFTVLPTRTYLNRAITSVRDRFGDPAPVRAIKVEASSSSRGADPTQITDGATNRFWSPAKAKGGDGQWVEATFEQPVRLLNVIITPGVSTVQEKFIGQGRPRDVVVTTIDDDNEQKSFPLTVQDKPGGQTFQVKASSVKRVRLTILSCYDAKNTELCAVGELEFRKRG
jgi:hypothetical protein